MNCGVSYKKQCATQAAAYLKQISASFFLTQAVVAANVFAHGLVWAKLQKNVHVLTILEEEVKSHNPFVIKRAVYFYLRLKLWVGDILACLTPSTWGVHGNVTEITSLSFYHLFLCPSFG